MFLLADDSLPGIINAELLIALLLLCYHLHINLMISYFMSYINQPSDAAMFVLLKVIT